MKRISFIFAILILLQSCGPHSASILSSGVALVSSNNVPRLVLSKSTDTLIKYKTGKSTIDHLVANSTYETELRDCEIYNSAELNEIFFETLDEIDCKINE